MTALAGVTLAPWGQTLHIAPQLIHGDPRVAAHVILSAAGLYAVATLVCAFALWRMAPWGPMSYGLFVASILLYMGLYLYLVRIPTPVGLGIVFFAVIAGLLYWGWRVVRNAYAHGAQAL